MIEFAGTIGRMGVPVAVVLAGLVMLFGRKNYFDAFLRGARQGLQTAVGLLPTLCALVVAVCILNASGASELLSGWLSPVAGALGIPADLLPLLLTRPFSGSASMAVYDRLLQESGPDSFCALCASVIMGSSDTVVYVLTVYFSAAGIRKTRHAFPCAFAVMFFCIFFSCFLCRIWFNAA